MGPKLIYLDNNASTAPDPMVVDAVASSLRDLYGNAASQHPLGLKAANAVEFAREQVASLISCDPRDVVFTSGATEADGLAIRGLWDASRLEGSLRDTILVGATEHPAVLESAVSLESAGAHVVVVPVDSHGIVDLDVLKSMVNEHTLLISVMAANNETGTVAPLREVVEIGRASGAYVHSDATQLAGRLAFDMKSLSLDLVSLSGHKMYGPKGVGVLATRKGVPLAPQIHGGGHERGLRSGTLNTAGIVGMGVAATLAAARLGEAAAIKDLRDMLEQGLSSRAPSVTLNGHRTSRLPNTVNLRFAGADAEAVMASLGPVAE